MARGDFVNDFLDQLADAFIERLSDRVGLQLKNGKANGKVTAKAAGTRRRSKLKGRKLDMGCRFPGCKNRSKGPRNHFLCEQHLKNPGWKAAQKQIEKAAEKSA